MIISLINAKGGVGRSTAALLLALVYSRQGKNVVVVDTDPLGSASFIAQRATDQGTPLPFAVSPLYLTEVNQEAETIAGIRALAEEYDTVIIDTPSHNYDAVVIADEVSDFVVVPIQPSLVDYEDTVSTLRSITSVPHGVLLTNVTGGEVLTRVFREVFATDGVFVFPTDLQHHEAFASLAFLHDTDFLARYDHLGTDLESLLDLEGSSITAQDSPHGLGDAITSGLMTGGSLRGQDVERKTRLRRPLDTYTDIHTCTQLMHRYITTPA